MHSQSPIRNPSKPQTGKKSSLIWVLLILFSAGIFFVTASLGVLGGYQTGLREYSRLQSLEEIKFLQEQYLLAVQDFEMGRYDLARQRFEYVLEQDPAFPGAAAKLVQVVQILYATATPTVIPPTVTPTPTRDLRPVQDQFAHAQSDYTQGNWNSVIDVLLGLRKEDAAYRVVEVDSLLYRALRNRGLQKIREEASLEGGMYDLSLAENFGPLDAQADNWRNLARLYVIGSGFWEVYPEQAVFYFSQVAAAAPGLRDASGWTASGRLWASLVQYGDFLAARDDWCAAQEKYDAAFAMRSDIALMEKASQAYDRCHPPTETPKPSETATGTFAPPAITVETPTATSLIPSATQALTHTPTIQVTVPQPSPTEAPSPIPTDTSPPPAATDTPPPPPEESTQTSTSES